MCESVSSPVSVWVCVRVHYMHCPTPPFFAMHVTHLEEHHPLKPRLH